MVFIVNNKLVFGSF